MSNDFMSWTYCERNFVKKIEVDISRARSMLNVADGRVNFLKDIKVDEKMFRFWLKVIMRL